MIEKVELEKRNKPKINITDIYLTILFHFLNVNMVFYSIFLFESKLLIFIFEFYILFQVIGKLNLIFLNIISIILSILIFIKLPLLSFGLIFSCITLLFNYNYLFKNKQYLDAK